MPDNLLHRINAADLIIEIVMVLVAHETEILKFVVDMNARYWSSNVL